MKTVAFFLIFLVLAVSSAASQTPDDKLITPGVGIGRWTLQMTLGELTTMNGLPIGVQGRDYSLDSNRPATSWASWGDARGYDISALIVPPARPEAQVDVLETRSENYKTAKGIGVGVPRDVVELAYGKPTAVTVSEVHPPFYSFYNTVRLIYDQIGLYVEVGQPRTRTTATQAFSVGVLRPGTARQLSKF